MATIHDLESRIHDLEPTLLWPQKVIITTSENTNVARGDVKIIPNAMPVHAFFKTCNKNSLKGDIPCTPD